MIYKEFHTYYSWFFGVWSGIFYSIILNGWSNKKTTKTGLICEDVIIGNFLNVFKKRLKEESIYFNHDNEVYKLSNMKNMTDEDKSDS